jgi:4-alpha-glucanotransferase
MTVAKLLIMIGLISPDYARWLPILRNQLKNMGLSRIRHVFAFAVTNNLMH